jgi:hypothetical protein
MSTTAGTFLLHHVYDHAPNALVPPPSTAVGNINNDKQCLAEWCPAGWYLVGWDGLEGGAQHPPTAAAIVLVVVIIVNYGGGGMGANN